MTDSVDLTTISLWLVILVSVLELVSFAGRGQSLLRSLYLKTPFGQRNILYRALTKLAPGVQIGYFVEILGAFAFKNPSAHTDHYTFVDRWCYVDAQTDKADRVLTYSVTARSFKFKPRLWGANLPKMSPLPPGYGKLLGDTTFGELCNEQWPLPSGVSGDLAGHRFGYFESHEYGNPGHYQTYLVGVSDAGPTTWPDEVSFPPELMGGVKLGAFDPQGGGYARRDEVRSFIEAESLRKFRTSARPNAYSVTSPHFSLFREGLALGLDADRVRTLPG